jgi:pimeloyl-ACP methyl ester carboxylesterase
MMTYPTAEPVADMKRLYIECLRDKAIPIEVQRDMQISADISRVETLDADHSPFLTQPDELWAILASLAPSSTAGGSASLPTAEPERT